MGAEPSQSSPCTNPPTHKSHFILRVDSLQEMRLRLLDPKCFHILSSQGPRLPGRARASGLVTSHLVRLQRPLHSHVAAVADGDVGLCPHLVGGLWVGGRESLDWLQALLLPVEVPATVLSWRPSSVLCREEPGRGVGGALSTWSVVTSQGRNGSHVGATRSGKPSRCFTPSSFKYLACL